MKLNVFFFFSKRILITNIQIIKFKKKMVKNIIDQFDTFEKFILRTTIFVPRRQYYIKNHSEDNKGNKISIFD